MTEERDLLQAASRLHRQAEQQLDQLTVARLRAARKRALDASPRPRFAWLLSGGLATAAVAAAVAGMVWFQLPSDSLAPVEPVVADVDILTTAESPEFYGELEFYDWLASKADAS
jgi:ferric-dicitrate binding protein FerR (iron transport regulator)